MHSQGARCGPRGLARSFLSCRTPRAHVLCAGAAERLVHNPAAHGLALQYPHLLQRPCAGTGDHSFSPRRVPDTITTAGSAAWSGGHASPAAHVTGTIRTWPFSKRTVRSDLERPGRFGRQTDIPYGRVNRFAARVLTRLSHDVEARHGITAPVVENGGGSGGACTGSSSWGRRVTRVPRARSFPNTRW